MVRLVKGAYWDTEIKRAQERGLDGYPVFTRKAMTDLNYVACARQLLALRPRIFPQFATHNALTVATVLELAGGEGGFEFQRLHGMGEALYAQLAEDRPDIACRTYAPVGSHRDLLAYLVRRLLENGANSSFVALAADEAVPVATLLRRPADIIGNADHARHPNIPLPRDLYRPQRANSRGIEFGERAALERSCVAAIAADSRVPATRQASSTATPADRPNRGDRTPRATGFKELEPDAGRQRARAHPGARRRPAGAARARISSRCCNARAARRWTTRSRKSARPSISAATTPREGREAVRRQARRCRARPARATCCALRGRGVFVAISPWNFPLAIFLGQVTAALMAGNAVVAKPAEQTPLIAAEAVRLLHEAGVPASALHLVPGDGRIGAALVAHRRHRRRRLHRLDRGRARRSTARSPPRTARSCR